MQNKIKEKDSEKDDDLIKLEPLTPDYYDGYNKTLKNVFNDKNIHNIAITADYGEGKSSVINSFLDENNEIKEETIIVSLSKYNYQENDDSLSNENRVEVQIINQIIYQINEKNIYLSKYKTKTNTKTSLRWFLSLLFPFLLILSYNLIFWSSEMKSFSEGDDIKFLLLKWLGWLILIIFLSALSFFFVFYQQWQKISNIVFTFFGSKIQAIYTKNNSFDLSVWDQEWREIIYIINYSKKNYIIFEDLDRLKNYEILNKLKDLCITLSKKNEKIKFIYTISDEAFSNGEEKTKFFDLIIPIVPISSEQNRINIFLKLLENKPELSYLYSISKFVYDIRTIKHICNEHNVYWKINKEKYLNFLNQEKWKTSNKLMSFLLLKTCFYDIYKYIKKNIYETNNKKSDDSVWKIEKEKYEFFDFLHKNIMSGFNKNYLFMDWNFIRNEYLLKITDINSIICYDQINEKDIDNVISDMAIHKIDTKYFLNYKIILKIFSEHNSKEYDFLWESISNLFKDIDSKETTKYVSLIIAKIISNITINEYTQVNDVFLNLASLINLVRNEKIFGNDLILFSKNEKNIFWSDLTKSEKANFENFHNEYNNDKEDPIINDYF